MNKTDKATMGAMAAGFIVMCVACGGSGSVGSINKPTFCDEHCMREKRRVSGERPAPKDGDTVMAEGATRAGKLSQPKNAPPEIVYPDGTRQDAGTVRMVVIPGGEK